MSDFWYWYISNSVSIQHCFLTSFENCQYAVRVAFSIWIWNWPNRVSCSCWKEMCSRHVERAERKSLKTVGEPQAFKQRDPTNNRNRIYEHWGTSSAQTKLSKLETASRTRSFYFSFLFIPLTSFYSRLRWYQSSY